MNVSVYSDYFRPLVSLLSSVLHRPLGKSVLPLVLLLISHSLLAENSESSAYELVGDRPLDCVE